MVNRLLAGVLQPRGATGSGTGDSGGCGTPTGSGYAPFVIDALFATLGSGDCEALGGGWQLRQGNNYVDEEIRTKMAERTNWGEYLDSAELHAQGDIQ